MKVCELFDLTGRTALVTGGSRGLGLSMAAALPEMGAKVTISARQLDELSDARRQLGVEGQEALTLTSDLSRPETIAPWWTEWWRRSGPLIFW